MSNSRNQTVNDFDSDLYELNKLVDQIFQALESVPMQSIFSFVGAELAEKKALIEEPEINWDMPFPNWDSVNDDSEMEDTDE